MSKTLKETKNNFKLYLKSLKTNKGENMTINTRYNR
jgi:hypothetical protein